MGVEQRYPEILPFLDDTDDYFNEGTEITVDARRYVVVTQRGEEDSGQLLFEITNHGLEFRDSDTAVDVLRHGTESQVTVSGPCGASDTNDHRDVHAEAVEQVDRFSSAEGPDGGNLACAWAVRNIVHNTVDRWITRTDATAIFDQELRACFGGTLQDDEVSAGGIIISPTETVDGRRNIGHVGLLGPHTGNGGRLIYSNSSSAAKWKQNFTLESWIAKYRERKGLKVRFFPLPLRGGVSNV
ncbi:hypothetical protein CN176_03635 [Sinorhizobium medicae]|uniref:hypothetical protein n=1 Tax=Sinorhizobium medicae TaxID=110321 RepID=UPI000FD7B27D|nr:hypothetical protein [Sinorhizobium medicae]RVJ45884.1 hypothetical protein CN176_03635 [Sinorhizobium medicae]